MCECDPNQVGIRKVTILIQTVVALPIEMPEGDNPLLNLFVSIGLNEQKAKETLKNETLSNELQALISEVSEQVMC